MTSYLTPVTKPKYQKLNSVQLPVSVGPRFEDLLTPRFKQPKNSRFDIPRSFSSRTKIKLGILSSSDKELVVFENLNAATCIHIFRDNDDSTTILLKDLGVSKVRPLLYQNGKVLLNIGTGKQSALLDISTGKASILEFEIQAFRETITSDRWVVGLRENWAATDVPGEVYVLDHEGNFLWGYIFNDTVKAPLIGTTAIHPYDIHIAENHNILITSYSLFYQFSYQGQLINRISLGEYAHKNDDEIAKFVNTMFGTEQHANIKSVAFFPENQLIVILERQTGVYCFDYDGNLQWNFHLSEEPKLDISYPARAGRGQLLHKIENIICVVDECGSGYWLDLEGKIIRHQNYPHKINHLYPIPKSNTYIATGQTQLGYDSYYINSLGEFTKLNIGYAIPFSFNNRSILYCDSYIWVSSQGETFDELLGDNVE
jgi:hypothetical protein